MVQRHNVASRRRNQTVYATVDAEYREATLKTRGSKERTGNLSVLLICFLSVAACIFISFKAWDSGNEESIDTFNSTVSEFQTLRVQLCGDVANQRFVLMYSISAAVAFNRVLVVPYDSYQDVSTLLPFNLGAYYDIKLLQTSVQGVGVQMLPEDGAPPFDVYLYIPMFNMSSREEYVSTFNTTDHMSFVCVDDAVKQFDPFDMPPYGPLQGLDGLKLINGLQSLFQRATATLHFTGSNGLTVVQLNLPSDCLVDGSCIPDNFHASLLSLHISPKYKIYLMDEYKHGKAEVYQQFLKMLTGLNYQVVTFRNVKVDLSAYDASVFEYELALTCQKFVGHSSNPTSSMIISERRHSGRWASYYSQNFIKFPGFWRLDPLPWVFSYGGSSFVNDDLVMMAVRSARKVGGLKPYCLWSGGTDRPMLNWLENAGVKVVNHQPLWHEDLWSEAVRLVEYSDMSKQWVPPFYRVKESLLAEFRILDIPIIPEFLAYQFVLYTDPGITFLQTFQLSDVDLPSSVAFPLSDSSSPLSVDSSVMLFNVSSLRNSYEELKLFLLSSKTSGYFPNYGMGLPSVYLKFYEQDVVKQKLPPYFSAKPHLAYDDKALILHWHGPKPEDYTAYYREGICRFGEDCEKGFFNSLCQYARVLVLNTNEDAVRSLLYSCVALFAPHLRDVFVF